jgi:hypothetical protein
VAVAPTQAPRPDSAVITVYRGSKSEKTKVDKDSTAKKDSSSTGAGNGHNP